MANPTSSIRLIRTTFIRAARLLLRADMRRPGGSRGWVAAAFADFVTPDGERDTVLSDLALRVRLAERQARRYRRGRASAAELTARALEVGAQADSGFLCHRDEPLRSYVDVSLKVRALRILVDRLAPLASRSPRELAATFAEHAPDPRAALIVHGDLLLADGDAEAAIAVARRALSMQAVCPTSEQLLLRALRRLREQGGSDPAGAIADLDLTDRFCDAPFRLLATGVEGNAFVCNCPSWVPFSVGNVFEAQTPDEIWNSDVAAEVRRSILDGDYRYCSRTQCSLLQADRLPRTQDVTDPLMRRYIDEHATKLPEPPQMVEINHDPTCNLACPSCRSAIIGAKPSERGRHDRAAERILLPLLKRVDGQLYISGGGEALSGPNMRAILAKINREEFPGLRVYLMTNGLLLTPKRWATLPDLPGSLHRVSVSVDAARAETYEQVRRPGRWAVITKNLEYIGSLRRDGLIPSLEMNFVVQRANFREMLEFVDLATHVGADRVWFQRLVNYGSYDGETYDAIDVCSPRHPLHPELLEILRTLRRRVDGKPSLNLTMLLSLLPEFVASDEPLAMTL